MEEGVWTVTHQLQCAAVFDQVTRNRLANKDSLLSEAGLGLNPKSECLHWSNIQMFAGHSFSYKPKDLFCKESS